MKNLFLRLKALKDTRAQDLIEYASWLVSLQLPPAR